MTGPNREVIKRRLGHVFAFITGKAFIRKADMAESALGWSLGRGLHSCAQRYMPEYGANFQVHVQTPFKKLNLYTATLTIVGEDEPLLHTRFCPTPVEALSNLRIMIMVCEDPGAKERLAELREAMRGTQEGAEQESNDDPFKEESNTEPFKEESRFEEIGDDSSCSSEEMANRIREREMLAELDLLAKEKLAREQWSFTVTQLSGKKSRRATERREKNNRGGD